MKPTEVKISLPIISSSFFLTLKGDVPEVIHTDIIHVLNLPLRPPKDFPQHLPGQQHRVMVRSHVVVHLQRQKQVNRRFSPMDVKSVVSFLTVLFPVRSVVTLYFLVLGIVSTSTFLISGMDDVLV